MITIISGTNRSGNVSIKVARRVNELLTSMEIEAQVLDLQKLPHDFVFRNDVYGNPDPGFTAIAEQFVANANAFVFVVPEYNGSFPGVCKAFIDAVWPEYFAQKKAAIIGISSGRAGNLRGSDQLTNVLHYLNVVVLPNKVNLFRIHEQIDDEDELVDEQTLDRLQRQMKDFVSL